VLQGALAHDSVDVRLAAMRAATAFIQVQPAISARNLSGVLPLNFSPAVLVGESRTEPRRTAAMCSVRTLDNCDP